MFGNTFGFFMGVFFAGQNKVIRLGLLFYSEVIRLGLLFYSELLRLKYKCVNKFFLM